MNTLRRFRLWILPAAAILAAPLAAGADTTFTLQVKARPGMLPAGRVLITLELAAPPAGSTISADGSAAAGLPGVAITPSGDQVTMTAGTGNEVRLEYLPKSLFAAPGNFCNLALGQDGHKDVSMSFTGPTVNAYRINTYAVGAPSAATSLDCGAAWKRVSSNAASITLAATDKGRHPLDIILVLDESGSMGSPPPPPAGAAGTKWSILNNSVISFVNRWEVLDAPVGSAEWSGDHIGMVFFSTNATANLFTGNFFRARGSAAPGPGHNWADVVGVMAAHGPTNSTAIGKGINTALDQYLAIPAAARNDATLVVMTDGLQNVGPMITTKPATTIQQLVPSGGGAAVDLFTYHIPMQTIAFGTPATTEADLLSRVAQQTSGVGQMTADAFGSSDAFADALVATLKGGTVSLAYRARGTLAGPVGPLVPVEIDGAVQRAVFSVEWDSRRSRGLDIQVFPPGVTPTPVSTGIPPTQRADAPASTVVGFDLPASGSPGTWQFRVVQRHPDNEPVSIPYNLSAHMLEGRLSFQLAFQELERGTGDRLGVRADVSYDHKPLDGLPTGAIRVRIGRPGEGIGTILHNSVTNIPPPGAGDVDSPYDRKVAQLAADANLVTRLSPADVATITLAPQGNGVYAGSFDNATLPGSYQFTTALDWDDPRTSKIHRIEVLKRIVAVNADASSSQVRVSPISGSPGSFLVTVTPRDRFNNYGGPNHAVIATVRGAGTIAGPPTDVNQTGDYVFRIDGVPAGTNPQVDFTFDGLPIGGTSTLAPPGSGKFRVFLDAGPNFPHGDFGQFIDGRYSVNAGLEGFVAANTSIEGILGYHAFKTPFITEPHIWQLSLNVKQYFGPGPLHFFLNAGGGAYRFDPGNTTKFGGNVGAGLLYDLSSTWGLEGVYNFHTISTSGSNTEFSTLQIGIRHTVF